MSQINAGGNPPGVCKSYVVTPVAAAVGPPANGYVAEDGTTYYVAEDGATYYVQEV